MDGKILMNGPGRQAVTFFCLAAAWLSAVAGSSSATSTTFTAVTTYHNDNLRTGWDQTEILLNPTSVGSGTKTGEVFELLHQIALDDQVDAQPLIVPNVTVSAGSASGTTHNIVYVATENNSIYAIDASTGTVLLQTNLGPPVPKSDLPFQCNNNGPNVGVSSTPVIDATSGTLYAIAYTLDGGKTPTYRLHALDLTSLSDKITPTVVTASAKLSDGSIYNLNASVSRQRTALLLANGNVYAGFASFCDLSANQSRGWVLGWNAGTLAPLTANKLTNTMSSSPNSFFLSSIWMSGYGLASDPSGNIFFVTGNSDQSGTTYNSVTNLSETAVEMSSDLTAVESFFTPGNHATLDKQDTDFGSGGLMLLPPQGGADLAVAAGKYGNLYLLNGDNLGNNAGGTGHALRSVAIGGCWCGQSYFTNSLGVGLVVSSGGANAIVWAVKTAPARLRKLRTTASVANGQDPGFFTSISSNGTKAPIIWAVGRPADPTFDIDLYAFNPGNGATLFTGVAGTWPNTTGNSNIVPTISGGQVYVASYKSLAIFGFGSPGALERIMPAAPPPLAPLPAGVHEIWGTVETVEGDKLTLQKRSGDTVTVDFAAASKSFHVAQPAVGHAMTVRGRYNGARVLVADGMLHAKPRHALWPADR